MINEKWYVCKPKCTPLGCILAIPGRNGEGEKLAKLYLSQGMDDVIIIGITPENYQWYPMPYGANNQTEAINGIQNAIESIEYVISEITGRFGFLKNKIILTGFSAGAVMAIQVAAHSENPFAAIVAHSGAILEPKSLPASKFDMPFFITHYQDDECFSWEERYIPMKKALQTKGYNICSLERKNGGHNILLEDLKMVIKQLKLILN